MRYRRLLLALLAASLTAPMPRAESPASRPNLLLILTDDQGVNSLSCYGGRHVATPHLDRLAAQGIRFEAAYATSQCTPTRAALLTGQQTARSGLWHVIPWYGTPWAPVREPAFREQLDRATFTFPKGLRAAGYVTGIAGKWHLTTNEDGNYVGLRPAAAKHYGFDFSSPPGPGSQNEGDKHVDYLTDEAIRFIRTHRDQPWFFLLSHHTVHGKVAAPAPLVAKYRAAGAPETGLHHATYLAALEHLDASVGRLLAALDALGQAGRTLVVFLSDNGGVHRLHDMQPFTAGPGTATRLTVASEEFSSAPLRAGKGAAYEGGIRVPGLARWPDVIRPGRVEATPIHVMDWAATFLALAGATAPAEHPLDGLNLAPLLRGERLPERALHWYFPFYELRWGVTPCAVIRDGDWKLIDSFGDAFDATGNYRPGPRVELFNLRQDPGEVEDVATREPARARALQEQLRAWIRSMGAEIPGSNPAYDPTRPLRETRVKPISAARPQGRD